MIIEESFSLHYSILTGLKFGQIGVQILKQRPRRSSDFKVSSSDFLQKRVSESRSDFTILIDCWYRVFSLRVTSTSV